MLLLLCLPACPRVCQKGRRELDTDENWPPSRSHKLKTFSCLKLVGVFQLVVVVAGSGWKRVLSAAEGEADQILYTLELSPLFMWSSV